MSETTRPLAGRTADPDTGSWRFSTRDLPPAERTSAWIDAMRRLRLPHVEPSGGAPVDGTVTVAVSPMGFQFARVEADAQVISGRSSDQVEGLWLSLLLEGAGVLQGTDLETRLAPGTIVCGVTRNASTLRLEGRHRQLLAIMPRPLIAPRLLSGLSKPVMLLDATRGTPAIFRRMLEATAHELDRIGTEDLRPVELAVIEFLVSCLAASGGTQARGGAEGARAALLHRILQRMETMLSDPDLSLASLAREAGISPRYLRKLFQAEEMSFSTTLRERRLDRCRADLISPLHAQLGISEIAFRWGFNDAAHFSRSFRDRFGTSPTDHRRSGGR